jgi:RNA 2',3'-cyclic 3'-phosphodiesterase
MRLFTALWPPDEAVRHLASAVEELPPQRLAEATEGLRKFRFVPSERWHLTLCFHGDDADQQWLTDRLERRMARTDVDPPRLRLAAAGVFRGVLWVGAEPAGESDETALRALARAAGGDPRSFRAHMTVARWSAGRADRDLLPGLFEQYVGPWWSAGEVALVRSDQGRGGPVYSTAHRVSVQRTRSGRPGRGQGP